MSTSQICNHQLTYLSTINATLELKYEYYAGYEICLSLSTRHEIDKNIIDSWFDLIGV